MKLILIIIYLLVITRNVNALTATVNETDAAVEQKNTNTTSSSEKDEEYEGKNDTLIIKQSHFQAYLSSLNENSKSKFYIIGSEFNENLNYIPEFEPTISDEIMTVSVTTSGLMVELKKEATSWFKKPITKGVKVFLTKLQDSTGKVLFSGKIHVAVILPIPSVQLISTTLENSKVPMIRIKGSNFNTKHTQFKLSNNLKDGIDYFTVIKSVSVAELTLLQGKEWTTDTTEGKFQVIAVDSGAGQVQVPSGCEFLIKSKSLLLPKVEKNAKLLLYNTMSHTLLVRGENFALNEDVHIELDPSDTKQNEDFVVSVLSSTELKLTLKEGKKWRKDESPGLLKIKKIFFGDEQKTPNDLLNVRIASVEKDFDGDVLLDSSRPRLNVYLSAKNSPMIYARVSEFPITTEKDEESSVITVTLGPSENGAAKTEDLIAEFHLHENDTVSTSSSSFSLKKSIGILTISHKDKSNGKWLSSPGPLFLEKVSINGKSYPCGKYTQLVDIIRDPFVKESPQQVIYRGVTTFMYINGSGFRFDMQDDVDAQIHPNEIEGQHLVFKPPLIQDVDYLLWQESESRLSLELLRNAEHREWYNSTKYTGPVTLVSVNTGAGLVPVNVVVAQMKSDPENTICSNTCRFAKDGTCDDTEESSTGSNCEWGTDCEDCGPRIPKLVHVMQPKERPSPDRCDDSCGKEYANDGVCDDGRPGSWFSFCDLGTDCTDCGPIPPSALEEGTSMCTSGKAGSTGAERQPGIPCVFPFVYNGIKYPYCAPGVGPDLDANSNLHSDGWGWCATTNDFANDKKWGSCIHCVDVVGDWTERNEYELDINDYEDDEVLVSVPISSSEYFARFFSATVFVIVVGLGIYIIDVFCCMSRRNQRYMPVIRDDLDSVVGPVRAKKLFKVGQD